MATIIQKHGNKYRVRFYDEVSGEYKVYPVLDTYDEAHSQASMIELDFYKDNKQLLPKGVSIGNSEFRLHIQSYLKTKDKSTSKLLGSSKTIKEIKELKLKCLSSIIG